MPQTHIHKRSSQHPWRGHRARRKDSPVLAALDLGTNNCRMLVARPEGESFKVFDSFSRITRLGEDITRTGELSEKARARTMNALKVCARKISADGVTHVRGVATEACRRASNGESFLRQAFEETGIDLELITPEEEARLALRGCASLLCTDKPYALVFDIGGGSTEITWIVMDKDNEPVARDVISLPLGVVTITDRYGRNGCMSPFEYGLVVSEVIAKLSTFNLINGILPLVMSGQVQMLGTSGTVTTLGAVYLDLPKYLRSQVDGMEIDFEQLLGVSRKLIDMDTPERASHPCIGEGRADLVVGGCAILEAICKLWPVGELTVADRGIREGILLGMVRDIRTPEEG